MIAVEELLKPISADSPCGEDVSYDPKFLALDTLVAGKPETQFSPAEEPDWKPVHNVCLELLNRSKNLRVAVTLCLALLKLEGAPGLRAGLTLLKGLLERYWADLYPRLDPEEDNDPLERVNILSSLSAPLSTFGDPMRFLQQLRRIPLANSPQMGQFSFADIAGDKTILPGGKEKSSAPPAQIEAAFRDTNADELAATAQAISDSAVLARDIDSFVMDTVGARRALDMGALVGMLMEIERCLAPYLANTFGHEQAAERELVGAVPNDQVKPHLRRRQSKASLISPMVRRARGFQRVARFARGRTFFGRLSVFANTIRAPSHRVLCRCSCGGRSGLWR